ncbi:MAG: GntR family transcriptional regulator [Christensenellales bacterium]|jgi:GntR family transcriptional regulator of gluconate operon
MPKFSIKTNLSDKIANILRQEILENKIRQGVHFNENELAERFGVSRGPVREALRTLETEGLVKIPSNGRAICQGFSLHDLSDYYGIRYFIESESIKRIFEEPDSPSYRKWISDLEELLKQARVCLGEDSQERFMQLDSQFHESFLTRANVKVYLFVWQILDNTNRCIMKVNRKHIVNKKLDDPGSTCAFHEEILLGLKNRDLDYTLASLQEHIERGAAAYAELIDTINSNNSENTGNDDGISAV